MKSTKYILCAFALSPTVLSSDHSYYSDVEISPVYPKNPIVNWLKSPYITTSPQLTHVSLTKNCSKLLSTSSRITHPEFEENNKKYYNELHQELTDLYVSFKFMDPYILNNIFFKTDERKYTSPYEILNFFKEAIGINKGEYLGQRYTNLRARNEGMDKLIEKYLSDEIDVSETLFCLVSLVNSFKYDVTDYIRLLIETSYYPFSLDESVSKMYFQTQVEFGQSHPKLTSFNNGVYYDELIKYFLSEKFIISDSLKSSDPILEFEEDLVELTRENGPINFFEQDIIGVSFNGNTRYDMCEVLARLIYTISVPDETNFTFLFHDGADTREIESLNKNNRQLLKFLFFIFNNIDYDNPQKKWELNDFDGKTSLTIFKEIEPHIYDIVDGKCALHLMSMYKDFFNEKFTDVYTGIKADEKTRVREVAENFLQDYHQAIVSDEEIDAHVEVLFKAKFFQEDFRNYLHFPLNEHVFNHDEFEEISKIYTSERRERLEDTYDHNTIDSLLYVSRNEYTHVSIIEIAFTWLTHSNNILHLGPDQVSWSVLNAIFVNRSLEYFLHYILRAGIDEHDITPDIHRRREYLADISRHFLYNFNAGPFFGKNLLYGDVQIEALVESGGVPQLISYIFAMGNCLDPLNFPLFDDDRLRVDPTRAPLQIGHLGKLKSTSHFVKLTDTDEFLSGDSVNSQQNVGTETLLFYGEFRAASTDHVPEEVHIDEVESDISPGDFMKALSAPDFQHQKSSESYRRPQAPRLIDLPMSDIGINFLLGQYGLSTYEGTSLTAPFQQITRLCRDRLSILIELYKRTSAISSEYSVRMFKNACQNIEKFASAEFFAIYDERIFALRRHKISERIRRENEVERLRRIEEGKKLRALQKARDEEEYEYESNTRGDNLGQFVRDNYFSESFLDKDSVLPSQTESVYGTERVPRSEMEIPREHRRKIKIGNMREESPVGNCGIGGCFMK